MISTRTNEKGLVSITVTVIIMLVITITVLSFAQIIRREQRQALDSQLSSQAFYAAESGINAARKYIQDKWIVNGETPRDKAVCNSGPNDPDYPTTALPMTVSRSANTSFSCLLVSGTPKSLKYDLSPSAPSKVFPIDANGTTIKSLEVTWTPSTQDAPRTGCSNSTSAPAALPAATAWPCRGYGIIRIDLVPATDLSREAMMQNMFTAFVNPARDVSSNQEVAYNSGTNILGGTANQGVRPIASCTDDKCTITVTGMTATKYYARVSTIYRETSLSVVAKGDSGDLSLVGAQVLLDATGRAQDVLRRIQVRVPLVGDSLHPDYGVQTTDSMCKQFTTYPGFPLSGC